MLIETLGHHVQPPEKDHLDWDYLESVAKDKEWVEGCLKVCVEVSEAQENLKCVNSFPVHVQHFFDAEVNLEETP